MVFSSPTGWVPQSGNNRNGAGRLNAVRPAPFALRSFPFGPVHLEILGEEFRDAFLRQGVLLGCGNPAFVQRADIALGIYGNTQDDVFLIPFGSVGQVITFLVVESLLQE